MGKLLALLTILILCIYTTAFAQSPLPVGKAQLNAGAGVSSWGLPAYVGFDVSVHKDITVGGELSVRGYRDRWRNNDYNHAIVGVSANANYHFNSLLKIPQNFDFYAGANVGHYLWLSPNDYNGPDASRPNFGGQIGGRYYFTERFGINFEGGTGNAFSGGKFGITLKL